MTPRRTPSDEQIRDAFGEVGDALQRAIVLSSDRVQSVLEDAVLRGRMTRRDAEELAGNLVTLGREQALELRSALARSVGDTVATAGEAVAATAGEAVATVHEAVATAVPGHRKPRRRTRSANGATATNGANGSTNGKHGATNGNGNGHATRVSPAVAKAATTSNVPDDPSTLTAKQLTELTGTLTTSELWTLRELEAAGKARATVIKAIDRKLDR